jgi:23S rRNA (guanosine2251-2'-O)-methyltransferase
MLEGRNPVVECLARGRRQVHAIWIDERTRPNPKVERLRSLAAERGVSIHPVSRQVLDERSVTGVHNGVIAEVDPLPRWTTADLLDTIEARGEAPFLLVVDEVRYEHNLGAIMRSALGAGAHGLIVPHTRGKGLTPVVQRVAMGAAEDVAFVREGLSSALKTLHRRGVMIVGADMDGAAPWELDLTGAIAIVLGGEDKGLTSTLRGKCDAIVGIPLVGGLQSLNVSVTAGVLLFERCRQLRTLGS